MLSHLAAADTVLRTEAQIRLFAFVCGNCNMLTAFWYLPVGVVRDTRLALATEFVICSWSLSAIGAGGKIVNVAEKLQRETM